MVWQGLTDGSHLSLRKLSLSKAEMVVTSEALEAVNYKLLPLLHLEPEIPFAICICFWAVCLLVYWDSMCTLSSWCAHPAFGSCGWPSGVLLLVDKGSLLCHRLPVFMCCVASLRETCSDSFTGTEQSGVDVYLFTGQINE